MVAAAMWNHLPAMLRAHQSQGLQRPRLTGADLRDMIAYVEGGTRQLPRGPLVVMPGKGARGREVFEGKRCAECHAVRTVGGTIGPDLGVAGKYRTQTLWNAETVQADLRDAIVFQKK